MNRENKILGEIALSLSGGGYRAAAYHLGVLDMLERLNLLEDVGSLSTVSGGTITGVYYAVCQTNGESFDKFFVELYRFLENRNIVAEAFEIVAKGRASGTSPSLIKAAAQVYASNDFLGDRKFGDLLDSDETHLSEQIFNATDFLHGVSFRFLKSASRRALIGNWFASMPKEIAKEVRLADIVAASSCFPSVFEPLAFPDDFEWDPKFSIESLREKLGAGFEKPIALMDGGIFDNQGVDSVKQVYRRQEKELGLFIISDVDNRADDLYAVAPPKAKGWISIGAITWISWGLFIIGVTSLVFLSFFAFVSYRSRELSPLMIGLIFGVPAFFTLAVLGAMAYVRRKFKELNDFAEDTAGVNLWPFLMPLSIPDLVNLGRSRITSLIAMSSNIFMKRIRDLTFYGLFTHPDYKDRLMPALIYDLLDRKHFPDVAKVETTRADHERSPKKCSDQLIATVTTAKAYETNLWFVEEEQLRGLIACGQATLCLKLIRFLEGRARKQEGDAPADEARLYERALGLWYELDHDSFSLLERRLRVDGKSEEAE